MLLLWPRGEDKAAAALFNRGDDCCLGLWGSCMGVPRAFAGCGIGCWSCCMRGLALVGEPICELAEEGDCCIFCTGGFESKAAKVISLSVDEDRLELTGD